MQTQICSQCNQKANLFGVIFLYAQSLGALDPSEQDSVKSDLLNEQMPRRQAELESSQCWLQLQVIIDKCTNTPQPCPGLRNLCYMASKLSCTVAQDVPSILWERLILQPQPALMLLQKVPHTISDMKLSNYSILCWFELPGDISFLLRLPSRH